MNKQRLDQTLTERRLVATRSQAESYIKLGYVKVNAVVVSKPGTTVGDNDAIELISIEQYVSRAALKLASVASILKLDFKNKIVLDIGSSTGGFTDYALKHGARKVIAVEVGTDQLHATLRSNRKIELHEKTDIRNVSLRHTGHHLRSRFHELTSPVNNYVEIDTPDIIVIDVSFISLREILPHVAKLSLRQTQIVAMMKPQFESGHSGLKHKGVIKNDKIRREILKDFELWIRQQFVIVDKADSKISGAKGNNERFYLLHKLK